MAIGHANLDETKDTSTRAVLVSEPKYYIRIQEDNKPPQYTHRLPRLKRNRSFHLTLDFICIGRIIAIASATSPKSTTELIGSIATRIVVQGVHVPEASQFQNL